MRISTLSHGASGLTTARPQVQKTTSSQEVEEAPLLRELAPDSFIVSAPTEDLAELRQSLSPGAELSPFKEKVLGAVGQETYLLVEGPLELAPLTFHGYDVFPNYVYSGEVFDTALPGFQSPPDEETQRPRHLEIVNVGPAWEITRGDQQAVSAVTDGGMDMNHPALQGALWKNPGEIAGNGLDDDKNGKVDDVHGYDFSDNDGNPGDPWGRHHTHVFGIAHAQGDGSAQGLAPEAKGMALKIAGGRRRFSSAVMVESYLYALQEGAKSINTSYNIDGFVGDRALESVYRDLADNDVLLFNSAGNEGRRDPRRSVFEDVVLVASTQTAPQSVDRRSDFSNYGAGIDIAAPGSDIVSTLPDGRTGALSGTSMASPVAMGVDLLVRSANPDWNRAQRWAQIAGTTDPIEELNPGEAGMLGFGRINAGRALTEELPPPTLTALPNTFPNGQTLDVKVRFDKVFDPQATNHKEAWRVENAEGEVVMQGPPKEIRLLTNEVNFNVSHLPAGSYTLIGSAEHLKDPFGQPLDGNKDGVPGDDLRVDFTRIS